MKQKFSIIFFIIILFLQLSGCGFKPLYGKNNQENTALLQKIEILPVSSIEGAELYNHFLNRNISSHDQEKKYVLKYKLKTIKGFNIIQRNSDILRNTITMHVEYELINKDTKAILFTDKFTRFSAYNTTFSPYNNYSSERNIIKDLARSSADEMQNRIIHFFKGI